jgi:putative hemolysin
VLELIVVFALVLLNGFFAMSEMSVMTSRKSRLKQMAQTSHRAQRALDLSEKPESFLSTVQIGITLIGVLTGLFGGEAIGMAIAERLQGLFPSLAASFTLVGEPQPWSELIGKTLAVALITFMTLIFGELVPKRLAITAPETIAGVVAVPMGWLAKAAFPFVWLLSHSTRLVLRMLGLGKDEVTTISEEEIRMLVSEGHEAGVIDADERNMMNRVLRLGDRTADSLMTPRKKITWLDAAAPYEDNLQTMHASAFSRFPVYRGDDQDVIGVLEVKSLLDRFGVEKPDLFVKLREPLFVSESTHAMKLLEIFREEQQSLALVVDEYGEMMGLVTLEDIIEEIVGDISDEHDVEVPGLRPQPDGSVTVEGAVPVRDLNRVMEWNLPDEEATTVAGLVIHEARSIPDAGQTFTFHGFRFRVLRKERNRITALRITPLKFGT